MNSQDRNRNKVNNIAMKFEINKNKQLMCGVVKNQCTMRLSFIGEAGVLGFRAETVFIEMFTVFFSKISTLHTFKYVNRFVNFVLLRNFRLDYDSKYGVPCQKYFEQFKLFPISSSEPFKLNVLRFRKTCAHAGVAGAPPCSSNYTYNLSAGRDWLAKCSI